ncbi:MAG: hypothetical protein ACJ74M_05415 [Gaiellaceae bacterium]
MDESETGSANFFGPALERDFVFLESDQPGRIAYAPLEKEKVANCVHRRFSPLDRFRQDVNVLLAPSTERE